MLLLRTDRFTSVRRALFLLFALCFLCRGRAEAARPALPLRCDAPGWLKESIGGSMNAVWRELMGSRISRRTALEALAVVASRLFSGFSVRLTENGVFLEPERVRPWVVVARMPDGADRLPDECQAWLTADIDRLRPRLLKLLEGVPPEALQWSADSFKARVDALAAECFPGWHTTVRVTADDRRAELKVGFYPRPPLLLAFSLETLSNTVPQLLADTLSDRTQEYLSSFTGFPVEWLERHKPELLAWLSGRQRDDDWLRFLQAKSENDIKLRTVAKVTSRVDSTTYSLRGWVAGNAGSEARLEAGAHLGRFFSVGDRVPAELYGEMILRFQNWRLDGRLGLRISPLRYVWIGLETSTEDESSLWYRLHVDFARTGVYGWLRYSEDDDVESALGYRLNRYVSLELFFDNKEDDRIHLRALSNL